MKYYSGIGSRNIPQDIKNIMYKLGSKLAKEGYILRSGGAKGADTAFEKGVSAAKAKGDMEIYLPYNGYQNRKKDNENYFVPIEFSNYKKAVLIADKFHLTFHRLSSEEKNFIVRDIYQVLGRDLKTSSDFVICWTPDGAVNNKQRSEKTGGTGQAISTASYYSIPVLNLKKEKHLHKISSYLKGESSLFVNKF